VSKLKNVFKGFKSYINSIQLQAEILYRDQFHAHLKELDRTASQKGLRVKMLDVGCSDGISTLSITRNLPTLEIYGLEVVEERVEKALANGIQARAGKGDETFPYEDAWFDVVTSNQVIEHLNNQDKFISEVYRVLKPGGVFLVCTASLASWHNVGALFMGWQPFPMTNFSEKDAAIGNPLAFHVGEEIEHVSMLHTRLYTLRALKDLLRLHRFKVVEALGTGYYPLPTFIARSASKIDPHHSAFQYIKAVKP
jgi:SAM-dependent methyltransferase